ncbi:MAG: DnaJ domain-containing protein, partial [Haliea sp.]
PELLPTALAFYRAPGQYSQLRDARLPLPAGVSELLGAHAHALSAEQIDDTAARLNCSPEECRAAVTFFIKQALLEARGDHYRTLGVSRDADSALIRQHYHYLIRLFHPDRDLNREGWETLYAPVINEAWNQLRTPAKRSQYDGSLPQPDAFDAVLAQRHEPAGAASAAATPRASAPVVRAGVVPRFLAGLPPRLVLGAVFGVPLLLIMLWLLMKPAPQNLRVAGQEVLFPEAGETDPPLAAGNSEARASAAGTMGGAAATPQTRTAPRRATSAELEQQVRERLASATSAVLGPGATAGTRHEPSPEAPTEVSRQPEFVIAAAVATISSPETVPVQRPAPAPAQDASLDRPPAPEPVDVPDPVPLLPALDGAQLGRVLEAFARSYAAGDVQRFSALFAVNADTSDARGRDAIRDLYQGFFSRPETREIRFGQMLWEYQSPFRSRGTGAARVTTVPLNGGAAASGELMITLEVEQTAAGPSIVGLYYQ